MFRCAVVGLGTVAPIHLEALAALEDVQLVAVCDSDEARAALAPELPFYQDYEAMYDDAELGLDAVHLCLPHDTHLPAARAALARGIAVLTEKPLTAQLDTAEELAALGREEGARLAVCFQNRLNPCTLALRERLASGACGAVVGVRGAVYWQRGPAYYEAAPWRGQLVRAGSGSMINQAIHTMDLVQLMAGGAPVEVSGCVCQLQALGEGVDIEDTATARIRFDNGATAFFVSTNANVMNEAVELVVHCERGQFALRGGRLWQVDAEGGEQLIAEDLRRSGEKFYYGAAHLDMIRAFYDWLGGDADAPVVSADEALVTMRLIDAIQRSSAAGSTPVAY